MKVGIHVACTVCGRQKAPHGRSVPLGVFYCDSDGCPGYYLSPLAGCLWPGETHEEFGYQICDYGVEER